MAVPQAATVPVFTASADSLEPLILDHKNGGKEAQRGDLRLSVDVHATAVWEARKGRIGPGGPPSGRGRRVCVALIRHGVSLRLRLRPSRQEVSILGSPAVPNPCVERRSFRGRNLAWSFVNRHVSCCNDLVSSQ